MEPARSDITDMPTQETLASSLQAQTLLAFTAMVFTLGVCTRKLALCLGASQPGCASALAVSALGGACLVLESDPARLQAAGRLGAVNFIVSDLTEALRILKNELRKGTPISVGLAGETELQVAAMLRRGVQPDLVCGDAGSTGMLQPFVALGAVPVSLPAALPPQLRGARLDFDMAGSLSGRRENDRSLLSMISGGTNQHHPIHALQTRWLTVAPRLFPRDRHRIYWNLENVFDEWCSAG